MIVRLYYRQRRSKRKERNDSQKRERKCRTRRQIPRRKVDWVRDRGEVHEIKKDLKREGRGKGRN